ncbi:MAG: ATP synthase F1 subunit delta [Anaerohalosphaera sp.]|nr:ATP synthase F1 subunit delta [Anaerohalosphaera sp.]
MSESVRHVVREIYSEVLFELAEEAGQVKEVMDDLERIVGVISGNDEFAALLNSQQLTGEEKTDIVQRIFKGRVSDLTLDFLRVLARRGRLSFLSGISDKYEVMVDVHHKRSLIEVTLAKSPSDDELEKLKNDLKDAINGDVKLVVNIDPEIIGGVIIKKGDKLVDNSLRRILNRAVKTIVQRSRDK